MSTALSMLAIALGLLAVFFLCAALVRGWRLLRDPGRLRLYAALDAMGIAQPALDAPLRAALQRCSHCDKRARCARVLASGDWTPLRGICPNIAYFDSLRRRA